MINVTVSTQTKLNKSPFYFAVMHWVNLLGESKYEWKSTKVKYIDESTPKLHKQSQQEAIKVAEEFRKAKSTALNATPQEEADYELDKLSNQHFAQYLIDWAEKQDIQKSNTTSSSYKSIITGIVAPYFKDKNITLKSLRPIHLQTFYDSQYERRIKRGKNKGQLVSTNTVYHYHTAIHKALNDAVTLGIIPNNPDNRTQIAQINNTTANFYNKDEAKSLLEKVSGDELELIVNLALYYGLRRSEILGLKMEAIDLKNNRIIIRHKVTQATRNNKRVLIAEDKMKTASSYRTLPLVPRVKELIIKELQRQEHNKQLYGNCYQNNNNYICVNDDGQLMKPDTVSRKFNKFLKENNLRVIKLHECRHTCASLLLANGVSMKEIQEWLGHSNYNTTANIYAHIDASSKFNSANTISNIFAQD